MMDQFAPDVPAIAQIADWCVERRKIWKREPLLFSREMLRMKLDR